MIHLILYPILTILLFSFIVTARKYQRLYNCKCQDEMDLIKINKHLRESNLLKLIQKSKSVHLTINGHRDYHETVEEHFKSINKEEIDDISKDVYEKMKELNTIIELQFYPNTPIGFYKVYHHDLETAINEAYASVCR